MHISSTFFYIFCQSRFIICYEFLIKKTIYKNIETTKNSVNYSGCRGRKSPRSSFTVFLSALVPIAVSSVTSHLDSVFCHGWNCDWVKTNKEILDLLQGPLFRCSAWLLFQGMTAQFFHCSSKDFMNIKTKLPLQEKIQAQFYFKRCRYRADDAVSKSIKIQLIWMLKWA